MNITKGRLPRGRSLQRRTKESMETGKYATGSLGFRWHFDFASGTSTAKAESQSVVIICKVCYEKRKK